MYLIFIFRFIRKDIVSHFRRSPRNILIKKLDELGSISFHESSVCVLFIILICLWMFRDPQFMSGWIHWLSIKMFVLLVITINYINNQLTLTDYF